MPLHFIERLRATDAYRLPHYITPLLMPAIDDEGLLTPLYSPDIGRPLTCYRIRYSLARQPAACSYHISPFHARPLLCARLYWFTSRSGYCRFPRRMTSVQHMVYRHALHARLRLRFSAFPEYGPPIIDARHCSGIFRFLSSFSFFARFATARWGIDKLYLLPPG